MFVMWHVSMANINMFLGWASYKFFVSARFFVRYSSSWLLIILLTKTDLWFIDFPSKWKISSIVLWFFFFNYLIHAHSSIYYYVRCTIKFINIHPMCTYNNRYEYSNKNCYCVHVWTHIILVLVPIHLHISAFTHKRVRTLRKNKHPH